MTHGVQTKIWEGAKKKIYRKIKTVWHGTGDVHPFKIPAQKYIPILAGLEPAYHVFNELIS